MAVLLPLTHDGFSYDQRKQIKEDLQTLVNLAYQMISDDGKINPEDLEQEDPIKRIQELITKISA